jgi:agmatine deiminase
LFIKDAAGDVAATDWHFNGWARYGNWRLDDAATGQIIDALGLRSWRPEVDGRRVALEGGAIDVNGAGLLLTTEECLLSPVQARNPGMGREQIEQVVADYLGTRKVLWLNNGVVGDDTHGHIDEIARFVGPRTVVAAVEDDPTDPNHWPLQENLERLRAMTDLDGRPLEVVTLPMPSPLTFAGERVPASYANFYIANDRVLVPTYNDANDRVALNTLAEVFPTRKVIGIYSGDLVLGQGTLHCLTMQQPKAGPAQS